MGEIADMMINGLMCEQCGVYMDDGEEPGYPRSCAGCRVDEETKLDYYEDEQGFTVHRKEDSARHKKGE